jgi:hypothetical protein
MRLCALCAVLLLCPAAFAGDEQAPAPPKLPRDWTPPPPATPPPSAPDAAVAARLDAIERTLARLEASAQASPQAAYASPQGAVLIPPPRPAAQLRIVPAERPRTVGTVPAYSESRDYVQVLVPPACHKRAMAAIGAKLVEAGQPRVKTMRVAPAALVQVQEVQPARAVYASGQGG